MGSAETAVQHDKPVRKRVSLRSLISARDEATGRKATLRHVEQMVTADAVKSMRVDGMELKLRDDRMIAFAEAIEGAWGNQILWGIPVRHLLIVELVLGSMAGVLIGMATYDTRAYWWALSLIQG